MPRMPDFTDVGQAPRANTGSVRRKAKSVIPQVLGNAADAFNRIDIQNKQDEAEQLRVNERVAAGRLNVKRQEMAEQDALELARARSDWNSRRLNEEDAYQIGKNPDSSKWEGSWEKNIAKHKTASASIITNPKLRAKFELDIEDDVLRGTLGIRNRRDELERGVRKENGLQAIQDNLTLATRPGMRPEEVDRIFAQTRADIDNLVSSGTITPEQAIRTRREFSRNFAQNKVKGEIQDDPANVYRHLQGGPGEIYYRKLRGAENASGDPKAKPRHTTWRRRP